MFLKMVGIIFIVSASTLIGFSYSARLEQRLKDLRSLRLALGTLEREMVFLSNPLPHALHSAARVGGSISQIFKDCGDLLTSKKGYCAFEAWNESIEKNWFNTHLQSEDKEILLSLGNNLGTYDIQNQTESIKMITSQLEVQEKNAEEEIKKSSKMYKSLGVLGGLAISIVLI